MIDFNKKFSNIFFNPGLHPDEATEPLVDIALGKTVTATFV
jgi:hypothetical protein